MVLRKGYVFSDVVDFTGIAYYLIHCSRISHYLCNVILFFVLAPIF
jgi:hypothetical protein